MHMKTKTLRNSLIILLVFAIFGFYFPQIKFASAQEDKIEKSLG